MHQMRYYYTNHIAVECVLYNIEGNGNVSGWV